MEEQVRKVYIITKSNEFQVELLGRMHCKFIKGDVTPISNIYYFQETVCVEGCYFRNMTFSVTYNLEDGDIHCTCQRFTFKGIQRRHILCVLGHNGVSELPDKYILRWWLRDVKRCHTKVKVGFNCVGEMMTQLINTMICLVNLWSL